MDFFDVITTRKTIRKYKENHPPIEDVKRIIDAGRLAPSATNTQNWKFIAIYDIEKKQKLHDALIKKYDEIASWKESEPYRNKITFSKSYSEFFINAPVLIIAVEFKKESYMNELFKEKGMSEEEIYQLRPDSSLLSMGAAIENMSLAAHALGYGTCWMCAPLVASYEYKKILNITEEARIVTFLTLGTPLDSSTAQPPKKTLEEVMQII